jgi:hypothetical protein
VKVAAVCGEVEQRSYALGSGSPGGIEYFHHELCRVKEEEEEEEKLQIMKKGTWIKTKET